jgi:squalene-hopene/tetraprenyl-beta-curcumene cyclase
MNDVMSVKSDSDTFLHTLENVRERLLARRTVRGNWEGELSASALSTATAAFALAVFARDSERCRRDASLACKCHTLVDSGLRWLVRHQNGDGGWGDTVKSISNISTTALGWAALSVGAGAAASGLAQAASAAGKWLERAAGSLKADRLAAAIAARYGKDRTFSVPILTMCAMAGRLGPAAQAWRLIPQLPFELAACPHQLFKFLQLPVVSYALPALIAMGQARHHQRPTRNPLTQLIRRLAQKRTLEVLNQIQPASGGFLEATPLTSFVCMSLVAAGQADHPVVAHCVDFLIRSAREDGSWAIDTNLATWVTTLSINAIAAGREPDQTLSEVDRVAVSEWLLDQQYRHEHPYTHAEPGGWAWTDLSGGVPDADDTAGALLALHNLGLETFRVIAAGQAGVKWLLGLQNRDGGMPTFCRGWGSLPFDRSGNDLTAHAILAWLAWRKYLPREAKRIDAAIGRGVRYLASTQRADGSWVPLWFGNQYAPKDENPTYGTARVLPALCAIDDGVAAELRQRGASWLLSAQNADGGWGGGSATPSSIEETALAVHSLSLIPSREAQLEESIGRGVRWLIERTDGGRFFEPSPIGFYFAKLWYYERDYPLIFTLGALGAAGRRMAQS